VTHTLVWTLVDEASVRRRDLYLITQHSQETDNHATGEIRTRDPSKREAADLSLSPRGQQDRLIPKLKITFLNLNL